MKQIKNILAFFLLFSLISCNDWLNVGPDNQIAEDDLFKTGEGYRTALNGIYQELSEKDVYGQELTWGLLSVLSQQYRLCGLPAYQDAQEYAYETQSLSPIIDELWKKMYNAIANCNNIIKRIEQANPDIFTMKETEKSIIMGEALALRGMIHFDLLRLFAPAPIKDNGTAILSYFEKYPSLFEPKLKLEEYMKLVISDMEKGRTLLATCDTVAPYNEWVHSTPIRLEGYSDGTIQDKFLRYRSTRLNYYVATALLARAYQYIDNKELALERAKEIIDLEYQFTPKSALNTNNKEEADRKMHEDIIFALFSNTIKENVREFQDGGTYGALTLYDINGIFAGENTDYRKQFLITNLKDGEMISLKWKESEDDMTARIQSPLIPMIRLSEMYYIAGEAILAKNPKQAIDWLNEVRIARGATYRLAETDRQDLYLGYILKEYRKEFIGEGHLFYLYKRLDIRPYGASPEVTVNMVLPIPASNEVIL